MRIPGIERDLLYGAKLVHDKAQLSTEMSAERAIKRAVVKLQGGNRRHEVNFETAEPSVGEYQGISYPSDGFGTRWATGRGCLTISPWWVRDSTKLELLSWRSTWSSSAASF